MPPTRSSPSSPPAAHRTRDARAATGVSTGFTVVELLVVIGIITFLVGMLLPGVNAARRQAELLRCMSNMRQVTAASLMRAADHRGYLMIGGKIYLDVPLDLRKVSPNERYPIAFGDRSQQRYQYSRMYNVNGPAVPTPWQASLSRYLITSFALPTDNWIKTEDALNDGRGLWKYFMCPGTDSVERARIGPTGELLADQQGTTVAVYENGRLDYLWSSNTDYVLNTGVLGFHSNPAYRRLRGNLSAVRDPARTLLFSDGQRRTDLPEPALFPSFKDGWQVWEPVLEQSPLPLSGTLAATPTVSSAQSFDRKRHRNRINLAFADGHVETRPITAKDLADVWILPPIK